MIGKIRSEKRVSALATPNGLKTHRNATHFYKRIGIKVAPKNRFRRNQGSCPGIDQTWQQDGNA
jgi:hypothetical protein